MKKCCVLILSVFLMMGMMSGCGSGSSNNKAVETRTVTDMAGRTVDIPVKVERIVPLANTPRMIAYLGLADKAVGMSGMDLKTVSPVTAYAYANKDRWGVLPVVGTDAAGATAYYPEQIIAVHPDIVLCSYAAEMADDIQAKTGIPTVAVPIGTLFGDDYEKALRFLADVCGVPQRAEEVITYINTCRQDLRTRSADIDDVEKPSVLGAAATFKGAHGIEGVYSRYAVFEAIAAKDVTRDITAPPGGVLVDKEQVLGWDPDYIFFDSGGVGLVKQDYGNNPGFYAQLKAVKNGNIYQYPSSTSYYSNVEIPIVNSYYAASVLYPDRFKDMTFREKANEVFRFFLGIDDYLSQLEAAGHGYQKVELGPR